MDKIYCIFGRGIYIIEDMVYVFWDIFIENIFFKSNRIEMVVCSVCYYLFLNLINVDIFDNRLIFGVYVFMVYVLRNFKFVNLSG